MSIPGAASPLFLGAAAVEAGPFQIDRSLRFNSGDSAYLDRTPSSAGNRKTWTWSNWIKRTKLGVAQFLFNATDHTSTTTVAYFRADDTLEFYDYQSGAYTTQLITSQVFRDVSAWFHLVVVWDTTQGTASDRAKIYINGSQVTSFGTSTYPNQDTQSRWNNNVIHDIGQDNNNNFLDGYLAEVNFVDGTALAPTDFGEYDSDNNWNPKDASGLTFGTNGFHLDFSDNSSNTALGDDSSGNNNDWTVNNLVAEQPTTLPGVAFDGSGDYLSVSDSANFELGSGDFTIEFYANPRSLSSDSTVISKYSSSNKSYLVWMNSTTVYFTYSTDGSSNAASLSATYSAALNKWTHFAVARSGSTLNMFVDGVLVSSPSISGTLYDGSSNLQIGRQEDGAQYYWNGFISNVRIIKGTALYTANFTPPTAPLSNVTNTVLLCCQSSSSASAAAVSPGTITVNGDAFATEFTDSTSASDSLIDTPMNYEASSGNNGGNYATLNPLDNGGLTISNGNLDYVRPSNGYTAARATIGVSSGKWYWEQTIVGTPNAGIFAGISTGGDLPTYPGQTATSYGYSYDGDKYTNNTNAAYGASYTTGDVLGVAFDADSGTLTFYKNGSSQGTAFTSLTSGPYFPTFSAYLSNAGSNVNFGQRPFAYTPPTNHKSLCTQNLPDPTIADPSTAMDVALWTGNSGTQTISGLGFTPDLVWGKCRSHGSTSPHIYDVVRGAGEALFPNSTGAEVTYTNYLTAFTSDGFTLGSGSELNYSSRTFVGWCWDGGTSTAANTDGSITSNVRANQSAGFSIASYTGNGTSGATVGHGLNANLGMVIIKSRSIADNWLVAHDGAGTTGDTLGGFSESYTLFLESSAAKSNFTNAAAALGNSSVFSIADGPEVNQSSTTYIAYCFSPVNQYSFFGSFEGNGSSDGPFVYTGFRSRWIMFKNADTAANWLIYDSARNTFNVTNLSIQADETNNETTVTNDDIDILSNGFKIRATRNDLNGSGDTITFAAFAENPFKTARAR